MRWQRLMGWQVLLVVLMLVVALGIGLIVGGGLNRAPPIDTAALELPTETATLDESPVAQATATSTIDTPQPTQQPVTPTPEPTVESTPTVAAPDVFIQDDFSTTVNGWPQEDTDTWSAGYEDGRYVMRLKGRTSIGFTARLPADNYRLSIDIAVTQGGAGIAFLRVEPATTYRFLITPDGAYSIEQSVQQQQESIVTKVVDWTAHPALTTDGSVNRILIERIGEQIRFFAGEEELSTFQVPAGNTSNRYGFVLTSRSGQGEAIFDNLLGERLP